MKLFSHLAVTLLAGAVAVSCSGSKDSLSHMPDRPFGWAGCISMTCAEAYDVCGGARGDSIVLKSDGGDMKDRIMDAVNSYSTVILDGAGEKVFPVSGFMRFEGLKNKTIVGRNGAVVSTVFEVTPDLRALLDSIGVKSMSDQGGGGPLSNGAYVREEREQHTRQAIIDYTGDESEAYRNAGLIGLSGCENIILRNLDLRGPGPVDVGGADILTVSDGSRHIWVDHCSFTDGLDGNFDINSRSDFITVSWCKFQYTDKAYDHKATNLIASSENPDQGVDNLNVTYACCIWGDGCEVRMPAVRWGTVHLLNNLYACPGNYFEAVYACIGSEILMEGCWFEPGVENIFRAEPNANGYTFRDNHFSEPFTPRDKGVVSVPYSYKVLPAEKVPDLLKLYAGPSL